MGGNNTDNTILKMEKINKSYSGVKVLKDVDFCLNHGEIHGLVGKNGAGKSTLMKILYGVENRDSGNIKIFEKDLGNDSKAKQKQRKHIAMIFQELSLIPTLTISQNILLNNEPKKYGFFIDIKRCNKLSKQILKNLNIDLDPNEKVGNISVTEKQVVEIAKALIQEKKILVMDEPTTPFTSDQVKNFFNIMKNLKKQGISIIYVSHNLREIFEICDRVTIIRDGRKVRTDELESLTMGQLISGITGPAKTTKKRYKIELLKQNNTPIFKVENLNLNAKLSNINFELYPGEVVGIAGLTGSGRTELLESMYGINRIDGGSIYLDGKKTSVKTPAKALKMGISLVPDERHVKGLVLDHTISDNIVLPIIDKLRYLFLINSNKVVEIVKKMINKLNIVTTDINQTVINLSGGNQQKVILAKSFAINARVLFMDDPTVGIDVGSKKEIIEIILEYVSTGENAVLFVSSELELLEKVCNRVFIMKKGKIVEEIQGKENIKESSIMSRIQKK